MAKETHGWGTPASRINLTIWAISLSVIGIRWQENAQFSPWYLLLIIPIWLILCLFTDMIFGITKLD